MSNLTNIPDNENSYENSTSYQNFIHEFSNLIVGAEAHDNPEAYEESVTCLALSTITLACVVFSYLVVRGVQGCYNRSFCKSNQYKKANDGNQMEKDEGNHFAYLEGVEIDKDQSKHRAAKL